MSSSDEYCSDIKNAALEAVSALIPDKSKAVYELAFNKFFEWMQLKKTTSVSEKVLLAFFQEKSKEIQSSTMWSLYSKLKSMIYLKQNVDISKYISLIASLKRKNVGHKAKKSNVFSKQDFERFLKEADDNQYLLVKVTFIIGIAGACRKIELLQLSTKHIVDNVEFLTVDIVDTKPHKPRQFTVTNGLMDGLDLLDILRRYISLRPPKTSNDRFFLGYRNGTVQPVGINTFAMMPKRIALFLGLSCAERYTGHCIRRSSTTILAEAGASLTSIKQHGGWKSNNVSEGYIENSIANKWKIATRILGSNEEAGPSKRQLLVPENPTTKLASATIRNEFANINAPNVVVTTSQNVHMSQELMIDDTNVKVETLPTPFNNRNANMMIAKKSLVTDTNVKVATFPNPFNNQNANIQGFHFHGCNFHFHSNQ